MIARPYALSAVQECFSVHPAVAITGPRQCGKTTLARHIAAREKTGSYFDLEKASDRQKLSVPEQTLGALEGLIVIDEIQRLPSLFQTLRVLLDRPRNSSRFLLLGCASPDLIRGVSESLAGRVGLVDLAGFDLRETGPDSLADLWLRGGFPRSFLAADDAASTVWRASFIRTFLERDIPQFGITVPSETLRRFWTMIAHYHGQVWNGAEFARALGASEPTARRYLDILAGSFMIRVLPPWFENMKKRQLKSPKIYVRDSGLFHSLLGLETRDQLLGHPKVGASWEGFVIEQLLAGLDSRTVSFWGTHGGAELDLLVTLRGQRHGFECKYSDAPGTGRSMRVAIDDLKLDRLWVIYPGQDRYVLDDRIAVVPARGIPELLRDIHTR